MRCLAFGAFGGAEIVMLIPLKSKCEEIDISKMHFIHLQSTFIMLFESEKMVLMAMFFFPGSNPTAAGGDNSCRVSSRGSKSTELDQGFP